jgi:hypothetical protein
MPWLKTKYLYELIINVLRPLPVRKLFSIIFNEKSRSVSRSVISIGKFKVGNTVKIKEITIPTITIKYKLIFLQKNNIADDIKIAANDPCDQVKIKQIPINTNPIFFNKPLN